MKQIVVNVDGLTIEGKQRVNEALAKIQNVPKLKDVDTDMAWFYAPSEHGLYIGWNSILKSESPTHTPEQVLEMAGMVANRKVRKDFDPSKEYSVNVLGCNEEEKKEVQQAFFDVGFQWLSTGKTYNHLDDAQYSNTTDEGTVTTHLLYGNTTDDYNMTAREFLELVYEPEKQGHIHAENMVLFAEDAKTHTEPRKLWQLKAIPYGWTDCKINPSWIPCVEYRRKPKTHIVNGVEIPDLRIKDFIEDNLAGDFIGYCADPLNEELYCDHYPVLTETTKRFIKLGILYEPTEDGKQAAILHSKAWLGV